MAKPKTFVLCIQNTGYEAALEPRKLYGVLPDRVASAHNQLRVIDESGEDYLYPSAWFVPVKLAASVRKRVLAAV